MEGSPSPPGSISPCGSKGPFHVTINLNGCPGRLAPIPSGRGPASPQTVGRDAAQAAKLRRHDAAQPAILREIETMIALPDQRISDMDRGIAALIAGDPELDGQARLLGDVPGIGPTVPATRLGPALRMRVLGVRA